MTYRTEFPDFDPATMPTIPAAFVDVSWRQDTCPHFIDPWRSLSLFIDYADADRREFPETPRFGLYSQPLNECGGATDVGLQVELVLTDDWAEIMAAYEAAPICPSVAYLTEQAGHVLARFIQEGVGQDDGGTASLYLTGEAFESTVRCYVEQEARDAAWRAGLNAAPGAPNPYPAWAPEFQAAFADGRATAAEAMGG